MRLRDLILITICGGLNYGYSTGVIALALPLYLDTNFEKIDPRRSIILIAPSLLLTAFFGCLLSYPLVLRFGRRKVILFLSLSSAISAGLSGAYENVWYLISFRMLLGFGVGLSSVVIPLFVSEHAPDDKRGTLVGYFQNSIAFGIFFGYLTSYTHSWRAMLSLGCLPGLFLFIFMIVFHLEESPYSYSSGETQRLNQEGKNLPGRNIKEERKGSRWTDLFSSKHRDKVVFGVVLSIGQQLTGVNAYIYFPTYILNSNDSGKTSEIFDPNNEVTFEELDLNLIKGIVALGAVNAVSVFISTFLVDRVGRRPLLVVGNIIMAAVSFGLALFLTIYKVPSEIQDPHFEIGIFVFTGLFLVAFESSNGPMFFVCINELFDPTIRESAAGFFNALMWLFNFFLSSIFLPIILERSSPLFYIFGFVGVFCAVAFYRMPETKGQRLEYNLPPIVPDKVVEEKNTISVRRVNLR